MSFGFGFALPHWQTLSGGFSPAGLFATGAQGAWYDPSDSTTLFSDTAGTTPSPTPGAGALSVVGKMLDKSGNGNHAISYNTTTARPELSARVNLLTFSEQFDNAAWTKTRTTVSANTTATTDPLGGNTADKIIEGVFVGNDCSVDYGLFTHTASVSYTLSVYAKAAERTRVLIIWPIAAAINPGLIVDLSAGTAVSTNGSPTVSIANAGNGWWRIALTVTSANPAFSNTIRIGPTANTTSFSTTIGYNGDGTSGIYIWGADLRPTNIGTSVPSYQRIADQYTYDSSGFPRYLVFNGTASGMYTPANLNLSGTDKATVFAGVRKQAAGTGQLVELSPLVSANNGTFSMPSDSGTGNWGTASKGTNPIVLAESATNSYVAPISTVNTGIHNLALSSNVATLRVNGSQVAVSGAGAGGGNFGTYPLNIGVRNAQSAAPTQLFLNGYIYSLIVVGAASTAAQISSTESWINVKEGGVY